MKTGCSAYNETSAMGMSQLDLILTVYRGTIGYLEEAKRAFEEKQFESGRTACDRARKCVVHLYTTLDMDKGKEIAQQLGSLYAYAIEHLDLAVASKSIGCLDNIIGVMTTLKEGWQGIKDKQDVRPSSGSAGDEIDSDVDMSESEKPAPPAERKRIIFSA